MAKKEFQIKNNKKNANQNLEKMIRVIARDECRKTKNGSWRQIIKEVILPELKKLEEISR